MGLMGWLGISASELFYLIAEIGVSIGFVTTVIRIKDKLSDE